MTKISDAFRIPTSEEEVRKLKLGSKLYVIGTVHIMEFPALDRFLKMHDKGERVPVDLKGGALHFTGPIVRKIESGYEMVATGHWGTLSPHVRLDRMIRDAGVRVIMGKGGLPNHTIDAMKEYGAVYLAGVGGCGCLYAQGVKKVRHVFWEEELGLPEALFVLEVKDFGPFFVAIDAHGNSLFREGAREREKRRGELLAELGLRE